MVEKELIPALDAVGEQYEKQIIFLPQLMNAAAASGAAFDEVRRVIGQSSAAGEGKGPIVLATVEGDIHDIGKNVVVGFQNFFRGVLLCHAVTFIRGYSYE